MTTSTVVWPSGYSYTITLCKDGGGNDSGGSSFIGTDVLNKGENYKDWRARLANGDQCTTVLSGTFHHRKTGSSFVIGVGTPIFDYITCNVVAYAKSMAGHIDGCEIPITLHNNQTSFTTADNLAKKRFIEKLRATQTSFQGGVFVGELKETLRMLESPAKSFRKGIADYIHTLKKRKWQVRRSQTRKRLHVARTIIADTWLETMYGLRPLISDIEDAAKTLIESGLHNYPRRPVMAFGRDLQYGGGWTTAFNGGMGQVLCRYETVAKKEVVYRAQVNMDHPVKTVWNSLGNTLEDFIPTVWELIPYSFLVDYFTNIGDVISAASYARSRVRWMAFTSVDMVSSKTVETQCVPTPSSYIKFTVSSGSVHEERSKKVIQRVPYEGSLVPTLEFTIPGFGTKWINMGALLLAQRSIVPFHR